MTAISRGAAAVTDFEPAVPDAVAEVLAGLRQPQKEVLPKYFYDERGSQLFDAICELPEYYPTRTELGIMRGHIDDMAHLIGPLASLIEFGSGSSLKTRILLEHMVQPAAYVPVDISRDHLLNTAEELSRRFPAIEVLPVTADFTHLFDLPKPRVMPERNIVYFPGSTIGNFHPPEALELLKVMRQEAKTGGALLIGVDLKKDVEILEAAYNDTAGITAEFNLNVLRRFNRELNADFELDAFRHRAIYNTELGRIEMYLVSQRAQIVTVAGSEIGFSAGEAILTECSYKYAVDEFAALAEQAGFELREVWTDDDRLFSVQYLESAD